MTDEQEDQDVEGKEEGMGEIKRLPNPGSDLALSLGCTCPVADNHNGFYPPSPPDGWWITEGCPIHAKDNGGDGDSAFQR